ncbi:ABC transporter permease [Kineosporia babensis]|uniref:ABC transporter permease n=1 Tax=Kineosporia babensis TaxID=499548 RepID=A0A9X1NAV8_9ACTN|nr:hypothetical protein [Kineosporia babensis]MCD5309906.1 hypothetical protein [Kineosporia babensis]
MTRDSASGKGPETDPAKEVTEAPEATDASTDKSAAGSEATKPVAVDTTSDEPGDTQDTTDEGALGAAGSGASEVAAAETADPKAGEAKTGDAAATGSDADAVKADAAAAGTTSSDAAASSDSSDSGSSPDLTLKPLPTAPGNQKAADSDAADSQAGTATTGTSAAAATTASPAVAATDSAAATSPAEATTASAVSDATNDAPATSPAEATTASPVSDATNDAPATTAGSDSTDGVEVISSDEATTASAGSEPPAGQTEKHSTLFPLVGTLVALAAIAALLIGSMALPIAKSAPEGVPVGVAGSDEELRGQLTTLMEQIGDQLGGDGTFKVSQFDSRDELQAATEDREVYGGFFLNVDTAEAEMLIATAGGIEVSDALQAVASALQQQAQIPVTVTDVVEQPTDDLRGKGLSAAALPLAIATALPVFGLIALYRRRPLAQLGGAVLASVFTGLTIGAVLTYGSGSTAGGNFVLLSAGLAAGTLATTLILLGIHALTGRIGLGVGTALLIVFGAPLAGLSVPPEWLPDPWGTIGQILPPGATATVLRSMAFFEGGGSRAALLVMVMWAVVGLMLLALGTLLNRSNQRLEQLQADEEAARQEVDLDDDKAPATV